ncbi:docking protein 3 [Esox lucius]|uniref:IRS-type PTB domain-containing protein n=1 Tax=Esox lucius TaxID=8010 RepID=A0A3P8YQN2_ESOLU|nr:docking protein 3 [Esox lucius]
MDTHVKAGQVYLQHRNVEKKWKKLWLALYPSSCSGVARLERQEVGGGEKSGASIAWKYQEKEKRVIRLSEVVSVLRLPPHAEACPKDHMAFCVESDSRRFVFAADKDECMDWVEKICEIAFKRSSTGQNNQLQMEDNQIYVSREEVSDFRVTVQQTDAAVLCGLQGEHYWLHVDQEELILKEGETRKFLLAWPYRLLRRYGRDKLAFSIEAGRRCDSGPGAFIFETSLAEDIFSRVETAIREQKASAVPGDDREAKDSFSKPAPVLPRSRSPLPKLPDNANIVEGAVRSRPASFHTRRLDMIGSEECPYSKPADDINPKAPTLSSYPVPPVPAHAAPGNRLEPLYTDPAVVLSLTPPRCTPPPPPTLPFTSSRHDSESEPVYSEVYHRASPPLERTPQKQNPGPNKEEPIYSEPCVGTIGKVPDSNKAPKVDPFAHLYSQVCKPVSLITPTTSSSSSSSSPSSSLTLSKTLATRRPTTGVQSGQP